jgi:hypothetical protein
MASIPLTMNTYICDRCGVALDEEAVRYVAKIEVFAARGPIRISMKDMEGDLKKYARELIKKCEGKSEKELMNEVHVSRQYLLCRPCQKEFLANPLGVEPL